MAKSKETLTKKELKQKLINSIQRMDKILTSDDKELVRDAHKNVQAANAQAGLIKKYTDIFGLGDEEDEDSGVSNMRAIKKY